MNGTPATIAAAIAEKKERASTIDRSRTWRRLTLLSALCVTALDAALLQRKYGLFTAGFLAGRPFGTIADSLAFLLLTVLLNATLIAPLTFAALFVSRRIRLRRTSALFLAVTIASLPLVLMDFVTYKVWSYLGDTFDFHVAQALTGHRLAEVFAVTAPLLFRPMFVIAAGVTTLGVVTALIERLEGAHSESIVMPSAASAGRHCGTLLVAASIMATCVSLRSETMGFALRWTPSGQLFNVILDRLSDIDRDGYGVLRNPVDLAPLNRAIYPYALDEPGNGIDEDGIGGDLPADRAGYEEAPVPAADWPMRPPVIVFLLEGVRADVIGTVQNGRRVTPVMDALATEGLKVDSAWSHVGSTVQSRYHLLTGSLIPGRGNDTLLDDFKRRGYEVTYFSGQDDDFGRIGLDYRRVDKFYDARQDVASRYSASTTPGSLAVPLGLVEERIRTYVEGRRTDAPLFLYVNFHDTHYPYNHPGLDNLLGVDLLSPGLISASHRGALTRTYLNATANVDRAIGQVIRTVTDRTGQQPAVIITSDHGESLFEQGMLGHGFALNDAQTRVPLIVRGLPVSVALPWAVTDLRRMINEAMVHGAQSSDRPVVRRPQTQRVFQFLGTLDTPAQIGWITPTGLFTYDFRSDRAGIWDSTVRQRDLVGIPRQMFRDLIYTWESMLLASKR